MTQCRQSGMDRYGVRGGGGSVGHDLHRHHNNSNGVLSDQVKNAIGGTTQLKQHRPRRSSARSYKTNCFSVGSVIVLLSLVLVVTVVAYYFLSQESKEINNYNIEDGDMKNDLDFLTNVPRITNKVLKFGKGSVQHGQDSRYWDKDDRRRDEDYDEDVPEKTRENPGNEAIHKNDASAKNENKSSSLGESSNLVHRGSGLYNEAGRHELKKYEAEYEASLRKVGQLKEDDDIRKQLSDDMQNGNDGTDFEDGYDDNIDAHDDETDKFDDNVRSQKPNEVKSSGGNKLHPATMDQPVFDDEGVSSNSLDENLHLTDKTFDNLKANSRYGSLLNEQSSKKTLSDSKRKSRRRKGSCDIKFLNSTSLLVEPPESRKFARFILQYAETEEKPIGDMQWVPRFAGHQSLEERENSFVARDQKIKCGFVKGSTELPITGFDLAEDDASYISRCHIAVISCIFGNSDRLRVPANKTITRFSKKNVCFVMFMDEVTLQMLSSESHEPDREEFIGLWRIVVVRNLPYDDMRRVGKIPKLLSHRLFPSARYSIWLDSKLRLQLDPVLILEYFLWRKGYEYAISNHYDRHCVWDEVARNKKLNKYNHTLIDQQFSFYQADGLKKFSSSNPNKLLPSNVPEGSFIIRAHTPMSNLFSCLWFNEVDRFTPRDQLSFAYTYQKLRRMNPNKPFYLNMFKDCERRAIAKLFRHRSEEKRNNYQKATE